MLIVLVGSCTIQPPLKLADDVPTTDFVLGEVVTDINVVWDTDEDWRDGWWYGWDETDVALWGEIAYPTPTNYEGRFYEYGEDTGASWTNLGYQTIYGNSFRRRFNYGYHDMLLWSNIDSQTGTQALIVDESDPNNIYATTSRTRVAFRAPGATRNVTFYSPEIFYSGYLDKMFLSKNIEDYDYFDEELNAWVKKFEIDLYPRVYIYLVQVAIYNNKGRIIGITDNALIDALSGAVEVHYGHTANTPVNVAYEMRLKNDLPARNGRRADIFGGKLHTFGLCDMKPWKVARSKEYAGSRTDLRNHLTMSLAFANHVDSTYSFDITPQLRRQAHGGVITIEIDADTLTVPRTSGSASGGFDPVIDEYTDSLEFIFNI